MGDQDPAHALQYGAITPRGVLGESIEGFHQGLGISNVAERPGGIPDGTVLAPKPDGTERLANQT